MKIDPRRLAELWAKGLSANQIATRLGASLTGVRQALQRLGVADVGRKTGSKGSYSGRNV